MASQEGSFDIVFKDTESELLYGEGRSFRANDAEILGVQLRRGYCVLRPGLSDRPEATGLRYDQLILPKGLSAGIYNNKRRELRTGLIWRIKASEALVHHTLGEESMEVYSPES